MSKNITEKYRSACDAALRLKDAVSDLEVTNFQHDETTPEGERIIRTYRNSLVKIFEISFDVFWKYAKEYLREIHGVDLNSPKTVFRELFKNECVNEQETKTLLAMVDDRNRLVHTYSEDVAIKISHEVPNYYILIHKVLEVLATTK